MKAMRLLAVLSIILLSTSCKKNPDDTKYTYIFVKPYCAVVTVGGVVGIKERCFSVDEIYKGKRIADGTAVIRIAGPSHLNKVQGPASFQEFLAVPADYLKRK